MFLCHLLLSRSVDYKKITEKFLWPQSTDLSWETVCTFRCGMAILAGHPDLNGTGAVVGLHVRAEEGREADERGEKGSSSPSVGLSSSPPLCPRGEERRMNDTVPLNQLSLKFQEVFALPESAPSWGWAARAADMPREPRPPNSGLPAPEE